MSHPLCYRRGMETIQLSLTLSRNPEPRFIDFPFRARSNDTVSDSESVKPADRRASSSKASDRAAANRNVRRTST